MSKIPQTPPDAKPSQTQAAPSQLEAKILELQQGQASLKAQLLRIEGKIDQILSRIGL